MPQFAKSETLLLVSKAKSNTLQLWETGFHLEASSGKKLVDLRQRAVADRLALARDFLTEGKQLMAMQRPLYRSAISRYYYCMYHAMRSVVYFSNGGDDHEQHTVLPTHTPSDLPDAALWQNALKNARERRNAADYNPYPKAATAWRSAATDLESDAIAFLPVARTYLRGKGCQFV